MGTVPYTPANLDSGPSTEIGLDTENASPPTAAYVGKDDSLWVMTATQNPFTVVTVNARLLMPNGDIKLNQWRVAAPTSKAGSYTQINLPECFLLSIAAVSNFSPGGVGSCYVGVVLSRLAPAVFNAAQVLCQGYTNFNQPVTWPSGVNTTSVDCVGVPRVVGGTTPAAGANISETVPSNTKWRLVSFRFTLTTNAVVKNRVVELLFDDGLNVFGASGVTFNQTASNVFTYNFAAGFAGVVNNGTPCYVQLPTPMQLFPLFRIRTNTTNLDAGDQFSLPIYLVEEWLIP